MVLDATSTPSVSAAPSAVASSDSSYEDSDGSSSEDEASTSAAKNQKSRLRRTSQSSDELTVNLRGADDQSSRSKLGRRLRIGHLLKMVLQDAQTRLFFKAQAVVQSEIRHYVPTADDLKWPDILLGTPPVP